MNDKMNELWETVKTQRDELRVRMHLGRADAKDEWQEMEEKWESAQDKIEEVLRDTGASAKEIEGVLRIIGEEIGSAYGRIKDRLASEQEKQQ